MEVRSNLGKCLDTGPWSSECKYQLGGGESRAQGLPRSLDLQGQLQRVVGRGTAGPGLPFRLLSQWVQARKEGGRAQLEENQKLQCPK